MADNGVKPRSMRGLPARERDGIRLLGAQVQLVTSIENVQKLLLALESHRPLLLIDFLQINQTSSSGLSNEEPAGLLETRLDIYAVEAGKVD